MSQTAITFAFEQWKAKEAVNGSRVVLDEFVFANVPGLDASKPIDRKEGMPAAGQIVYRQAVNKTGVVNNNAVVYSVTLGTEVGDFDFNWIGLVNKATNTVAMIVYAPVQRKVANHAGQQGNAITRSFVMEYDGAASETAITTPAETWQIDFTARLGGIDEMQRVINHDHYGAGAFFGNGFLVAKTGAQYFVTAGTGYVGGLRAVLAANQNITVTTKPIKVWADVSLQGNVVSQWAAVVKFTVAATAADYTDNAGFKHYVFAVASIDAAGNITDLRPKGSLSDQAGNDAYLRKDDNLASLKDKAKSRDNLGLKAAALYDVGINAGQLMENGAFGVGGATKILSSSDTLAIIQSLKTGKYAVNAGSLDMPVKDLAYCLDWTLTSPTSGGHGVLIATGLITAPSSWDRVYRNTLRNGMWQGWVVLYDTENKPTARDVDAVSASQGGEFHKEIQASRGVMVANAWQGKPGGIFPGNGDDRTFDVCNVDIKSWYGIGFYNSSGAGTQGRTIIMNVRAGYLEAKGNIKGLGLYDASGRVYSPGNKPTAADVGALTDAQAMQKYALRAYKVNGKPLTGDVNLLAADVNAWNKTEADTRYLMLTGGQVKGKTGFLGGIHLGNENTYLEAGGDAAGFTTNNLLLKSWFGIGFVNTCTTTGIQGVSGFVNVRNGDLQMKRNITADAQIIEAGKRVYSPNNKPTAADVNAWNKTEADGRYLMKSGGQLTGVVKTSAEIQSTTSDNYRLIGGDYGTYWRNDGNNLYLLMTKAKDQYGTYNDLRPLSVDVKTGNITFGHTMYVNGWLRVNKNISIGEDLYVDRNASVAGNLTVGKSTHSSDGNILGSRWGNKWLWDAIVEQDNGRVDWNSFNNRTHVAGDRNAWWYKDELTGFIIQGGVVNRVDYVNWVGFPRGYARECFGVQLTLTSSNGTWFGDSRVNIQPRDLSNNGFNAMMDGQEQVVFWQSVGV